MLWQSNDIERLAKAFRLLFHLRNSQQQEVDFQTKPHSFEKTLKHRDHSSNDDVIKLTSSFSKAEKSSHRKVSTIKQNRPSTRIRSHKNIRGQPSCQSTFQRPWCKHIDIKYCFVRDALHSINIIKCSTADMLAGMMINLLTRAKLKKCKGLIFRLYLKLEIWCFHIFINKQNNNKTACGGVGSLITSTIISPLFTHFLSYKLLMNFSPLYKTHVSCFLICSSLSIPNPFFHRRMWTLTKSINQASQQPTKKINLLSLKIFTDIYTHFRRYMVTATWTHTTLSPFTRHHRVTFMFALMTLGKVCIQIFSTLRNE